MGWFHPRNVVRSLGALALLLALGLVVPGSAFAVITGIARQTDGQPASYVTVLAKTSSGSSIWSDVTGADGSYMIRNVPAGGCTIQFTDYGYFADPGGRYLQYYSGNTADPAQAVLFHDGDTCNVVLPAAGKITGRLTIRGSGAPVAGAEVYAYKVGGGKAWHNPHTDTSGNYTLGGLETGDYILTFIADWYDWYKGGSFAAEATPVHATVGAVTSGIDEQLAPSAYITGIVTDASTHLPIANVGGVAFIYSSGAWIKYCGALTDANGQYTAKVPGDMGPVRMWFADSQNLYIPVAYGGTSLGTGRDITVSAGGTTTGIDVQLTPLSGATKVSDSGSGVSVDLINPSGPTPTLHVGNPSTTPRPPLHFQLNGQYYDISVTPTYNGIAMVSVPYDPAKVTGDPLLLKLLHYSNGAWVDITLRVDTTNHLVIGVTDSFSPFAVFEPVGDSGSTPPQPRTSTGASSSWSLAFMTLAGIVAVGVRRRRRSVA